jgi:hypothetical protein
MTVFVTLGRAHVDRSRYPIERDEAAFPCSDSFARRLYFHVALYSSLYWEIHSC